MMKQILISILISLGSASLFSQEQNLASDFEMLDTLNQVSESKRVFKNAKNNKIENLGIAFSADTTIPLDSVTTIFLKGIELAAVRCPSYGSGLNK